MGKTSAVKVFREVKPPSPRSAYILGHEDTAPKASPDEAGEFETQRLRIDFAVERLEKYRDQHGFKPDEVSAFCATFERFTRLMKRLEVS
jgi:hypothetical protein